VCIFAVYLQAAQQREEERLKLSNSQDQAARLGKGEPLSRAPRTAQAQVEQ
jgi:hypothetical protein